MSQDSHMRELVSDVGVVLIWTFSVHRLGACKHDVPAGLTEILHNGTPEHVLVQYNKTEGNDVPVERQRISKLVFRLNFLVVEAKPNSDF